MSASQSTVASEPGRALVVCERWLGSNATAMMTALRRQGWNVNDFCEKEYVPLHWETSLMKVVGKVVRNRAAYELNQAILRAAQRHTPDLFLVFKGRYVFAATIQALKRRGIKAYCVYPDVSFRVHGPHIPRALPCYDWVFTTKRFGLDDMREQLGITFASQILHAADPELHRPVPLSERDLADFACDASFIGTWSPKKERILTEVVECLPSLHLKVFGSQWERVDRTSPLAPHIAGHPVYTLDYVKAIRASTINIAILSEARQGASAGDQITSRTFHIPASGGFMLHERTDELLSVFEEGTHTACFTDAAELADKIAYYLEHDDERQRIATAGREETAAGHTWDQRIEAILIKHAELVSQS